MFLVYTKYVGSAHTSIFTRIGGTSNRNIMDMHLESIYIQRFGTASTNDLYKYNLIVSNEKMPT